MLAGQSDSAESSQLHPASVYPAKAKRVVQMFMAGAASHIDLFDYKPELIKRHGQVSDFGEPVEAFQNGLGPWLKPVWNFRPYGQCGKHLGEIVSPLGEVVDEIAFVHNMVSPSGVHSQATLLQSTGFVLPGFPGAGCWVGYGLGSLNDNLPMFVVLPDQRGLGSNGVKNWDSGFLPAEYSGTVVYPGLESPIADLRVHRAGTFVSDTSEFSTQRILAELNLRHARNRKGDARLESRIRSYELAARMQMAAPEALDFSNEPEHVMKLYGLHSAPKAWPTEINSAEETHAFSTRCLAARRLLERGVRFVQIWSGNDNGFPRRNWDSHEDVERDHGPLASGMAQEPQHSSPISSEQDFLRTQSFCGLLNLVGCLRVRVEKDAITILSFLQTGFAAEALREASRMARVMSLGINHSNETAQQGYTTSTRLF